MPRYYVGVKQTLLSPTVRPATRNDLPQITEIYNHAVANSTVTFDTEPMSVEDREAWFSDHGGMYPLLVAETDRIVGWASLSRWAQKAAYDRSTEISLYVHPEFRARGVGRLLTGEILRAGREAGIHTVIARIAGGNDVSRRLCESFGFRYIGVMREAGWKFERWIDVHFYQLLFEGDDR